MKYLNHKLTGLIFLFAMLGGAPARGETVWLDELDLTRTQQGWGQPGQNVSVGGNKLTLGGREFAHGLGTHAASSLAIDLKGGADQFTALVGLDDEIKTNPGSVEFKVLGDGRLLWRSWVMHPGDAAKEVAVDLAGVKYLTLNVTAGGDGIDFDHADWADAKFAISGAKPVALETVREEPYILTPPAPPTPRINGAHIYGCRPGHPFLFTVAATGERPLKFSARHLPAGLKLDADTGIITGAVKKRGTYVVALTAKNSRGVDRRELQIVCGDQIALTPPMGWNSWNCFASDVSEEKVRAAADAMAKSGLTEHGWSYINVDDYWEKNPGSKDPTLGGPGRDAQGNIVPNPRFPDLKALADHIHSLGLKMGIYSSPGPLTCGGCLASFDRETNDARSYAAWGIDYLKYDWCSYRPELETRRENPADYGAWTNAWSSSEFQSRENFMRPYALMRNALDHVDRDIVYSLCQYGMGNVWEWGGRVGGNSWRTTGDIVDTWAGMSGIGFRQMGREPFAKPGNWNDPDMLVVGKVGWGPKLHPTHLTPNEQYTHITLWCLLSAPLLIGCDLTQLDDFTRNLLCNDEVLAVDQDPLGRQARRVSKNGDLEVWAKPLADGSLAVGLFNRGELPDKVTARWSDLQLAGQYRVRDLWRQQDLGDFAGQYETTVPRHGAALVRIYLTGPNAAGHPVSNSP